jgi:hypothetical protein
MNDYLSKPVPIDALKRTLEKWLPAVQREQHGPEGEAA